MSEDVRRAGRSGRRVARAAAVVVLALGPVALTAGCGFDAQTNQPYTPADGTNLDVGTDGALKVRNLVVVSRAKGEGFISASLIGNAEDQMTGVSVAPTKVDGTQGSAVTASPAQPLQLGGGSLVVLTNLPLLTVQSPDLVAGLSATVTLQFTKAGPVTLNAPVVDGTQGQWATISPSPTPSALAGDSASPTPSASPTG